MDATRKNSKRTLEAAIDAVRSSEPGRMEMENGAARVWARIGQELTPESSMSSSVDQIRNCDDYRALIPDYVAGRLSSARALLFTDHTHECVTCRNAWNTARGAAPRGRVIGAERRFNRTAVVFAIAAALIAGVALEQTGYVNFLWPVVEVNAMARTIDGRLYRIAGLNVNPVAAGDALKATEPIRTAAGSRAVIELADGTRIEMRERSQLSLAGTHDGIRINLERGSVIVEAAKQRNGHLYVATEDCTVSVVGTVFAVSTGVKGSRVSVIEGEVRVTQPSSVEKALYPGQQVTTTPSLTNVSIQEEISWSRNLDAHLALLRALADVNAFLRDRVPGAQLRFTSTLLPLVPANTVMYGAFPGKTVTQAQLSFNGDRSGVAAWLAPPAPMGALEFVSPRAYGVASIVTKDGRAMLDEIMNLGAGFKDGVDALEKFHHETGVDIRRDLAEPLGGEFMLAMDGPFLPTPSWKAVAEVYDSARLQNTIERLVAEISSDVAQSGEPGVTLSSEAAGGQIYYRLRRANGVGPEIHYTYTQGYIVAAPSRGLVSQALQYQQSRSSIANSAKFRSMMPADGADHCSAILYQNLMETASSLASYVPAVGGITSDQLQTLRQTIELTPATLVCAAGEPNRIVMGYQGDLGFNVLMLGGLRSMIQTVGRARN